MIDALVENIIVSRERRRRQCPLGTTDAGSLRRGPMFIFPRRSSNTARMRDASTAARCMQRCAHDDFGHAEPDEGRAGATGARQTSFHAFVTRHFGHMIFIMMTRQPGTARRPRCRPRGRIYARSSAGEALLYAFRVDIDDARHSHTTIHAQASAATHDDALATSGRDGISAQAAFADAAIAAKSAS